MVGVCRYVCYRNMVVKVLVHIHAGEAHIIELTGALLMWSLLLGLPLSGIALIVPITATSIVMSGLYNCKSLYQCKFKSLTQ